MIDIILFIFCCALFYGAFWCGNKYGTLVRMWDALVAKIKSTTGKAS